MVVWSFDQAGTPISTEWALVGPVVFTLIGFWWYDELHEGAKSFGGWRVKERTSDVFLQGMSFVLALYLGVTLVWILVEGLRYSGLGTLALAMFTAYYLLRMIDYRSVKAQTRVVGFIPPILFLALAILPPLSLLVPPISSLVVLQVGVYFPALFLLFGVSTLLVYLDSDDLKVRRPSAWVEIGDAGFYNIMAAYLFMANDAFSVVIRPSSFGEQITYFMILIMAVLVSFLYWRPWFVRRAWLKKTKEGRKVLTKASKDNWLAETAARSRLAYVVGEVVFFLAITTLYVGIVLLYEAAASPSTTSFLFGVLMLTSSFSMITYGLRRSGLPFKMRELAEYMSVRQLPDVRSLKQRLNAQISLFAGTLGILLTLALESAPNQSLIFPNAGVEYSYALYSEFFVVLVLVFVNAYVRFQAFDGEQYASPQFARSVNGITQFTFRIWFIMWGGITGLIAVALGIPLYVDAPIVVGAILVTVVVLVYIELIRARERKWKAERHAKRSVGSPDSLP
jgi:hypothetical protein